MVCTFVAACDQLHDLVFDLACSADWCAEAGAFAGSVNSGGDVGYVEFGAMADMQIQIFGIQMTLRHLLSLCGCIL